MTILFSFLISINAVFTFGLLSPSSTSTTQYASNSPEKNVHSDAALLHQILTQETTLRMELERNVRDLTKQFEQMKKDQTAAETEISILKQAKIDQDALNQQLLKNITKLTKENDNLKEAIMYHQQHVNVSLNSIPIPGQTVCQCDFANITKEIQNFKREVRYISLSILDLERETESMNSSILQTFNTSANLINQELLQINVGIQNFSTEYEQDKHQQAYINADLKDQQINVSNTLKDHIDSEVLNLRKKILWVREQKQ
ncbi:uncharacterized protein LOC134264289 [Saccostrea cucullata]|uniref:uncharacterized protein LOC134264289 n=1 Tax=Saccostrea cuccullata TaxID=36930 RepID=UPI002ED47515